MLTAECCTRCCKKRLPPVMANAAPNHMIHHIEMVRREESFRRPEELALTIVLRPLGSARVVDDGSDLQTGYERLEAKMTTLHEAAQQVRSC